VQVVLVVRDEIVERGEVALERTLRERAITGALGLPLRIETRGRVAR
jgi:hypothetical protein